ncbi:hypothetical protein LSCM1_02473 [Leishmania martiniquensis]|uniref:Uncharacterized protein n=1 Tax=Leishmania martiniquensis TaxID=1580590 RepID=A0A836H1Y2_9TRYP|nr:hypothetical protein LSCM1_02473 [Leishmania martiniquensis]
MYARAVNDHISGISAADLAQRLVETSTRRLAQASVVPDTLPQRPLPSCVSALLWDAKCSGAGPPRTALLCGDVVDVTSSSLDQTLSCVVLSENVRFRFARSRHRRLTSVLSSAAASSSFRFGRVDVTHFYWMDECAPTVAHAEWSAPWTVLQKRIAEWAVHAFTRNPLLRNISLQTIESVFPALLAFSSHEREDLLKQAAELLGQGTLIWYGSAMIKQFRESATSLRLSLLTPREARGSAALLFALATAQEVVGTQRTEVAWAVRFLSEEYGLRRVASSPALTTALLLALRATAPVYTNTCVRKERRQYHLLQPYLFPLSCTDMATLQSILPSTQFSSQGHYREFVQRLRDVAAAVLTTAPPSFHIPALRSLAHKDDVDAFFCANCVLQIHRDTLVAQSCGGVPSSLTTLAAAEPSAAARAQLLETAPKWWELQTKRTISGVARDETALQINVKASAAALREFHGSDHPLLAAIHRTRKRQRQSEQLTSQTMETALEGASIRLKRRTFLQLVDILALSADDEDRNGKARRYLEQHHVGETQIRAFIKLLSSPRGS